MRPSELLSRAEIDLLRRGLIEWSGPARCGDLFARGLGFASADDLVDRTFEYRRDLAEDRSLDMDDWTRILLAVEIVFVSDVVGSGVEWPTTTGFGDGDTLLMLRTIQRKLVRVVRHGGLG